MRIRVGYRTRCWTRRTAPRFGVVHRGGRAFVACVYARRTKHRICYRVVDEYGGDTLSKRRTRTSVRPLTLGELEAFFNGAWSIFQALEGNFADEGYPTDDMQAFVVGVESEFYPEFGRLYRARIAEWAADRHVDDGDDDETDGGSEQP